MRRTLARPYAAFRSNVFAIPPANDSTVTFSSVMAPNFSGRVPLRRQMVPLDVTAMLAAVVVHKLAHEMIEVPLTEHNELVQALERQSSR